MKPKTFSDYFGTINFRDRNIVGPDVGQEAIDVAMECRAIMNRTAVFLTITDNQRHIETHNLMSDKMAEHIAKAFGMVKCDRCSRYDFEGVPACLHEGCAKLIVNEEHTKQGIQKA